jgi:ribonuclease HIII
MQLCLPLAASLEKVNRYRELLESVLASRGVKFLGARAAVISPFEFNEAIKSSGNKALLLFDNCVKLVGGLWKEYPRLEILCDKHGGRNRYGALLSKALGRCTVKVLTEGPEVSTYEAVEVLRGLKISFILKAEEKHLPVALASMYSKYIRELFLKLFNRYWQEKLPGLKVTAGYPNDAKRFLNDIDRVKTSLKIEDEILIRKR